MALTGPLLDRATRAAAALAALSARAGGTALDAEYARIVEAGPEPRNGGRCRGCGRETRYDRSPAAPAAGGLPGGLRRPKHFLRLVRVLLAFLKRRLEDDGEDATAAPAAFVLDLGAATGVDGTALPYLGRRLRSLCAALEAPVDGALADLCDFFGLLVRDDGDGGGFAVVAADSTVKIACLDAAVAFAPLRAAECFIACAPFVAAFDARVLGAGAEVRRIPPRPLKPRGPLALVVSKGADQLPLGPKDAASVRNYGALLVALAGAVPDGIVAWLPSLKILEKCVSRWDELGLLARVLATKVVCIEVDSAAGTSAALQSYRAACDAGRGALFLGVARGRASDVSFDGRYGRCVVVAGVPYRTHDDLALRARLDFLLRVHSTREADFLAVDALKAAVRCGASALGGGGGDYASIVLADARFARRDRRAALPAWCAVDDGRASLSADAALSAIGAFLKKCAQPVVAPRFTIKIPPKAEAAAVKAEPAAVKAEPA